MTEKITDKRLKALKESCENPGAQWGRALPNSEILSMTEELLSLREQMEVVKGTKIFIDELQEQKRRLIEVGKKLAAYVEGEWTWDGVVHVDVWHEWESLMKELDA